MDEFDRLLYQGTANLPPELTGSEPPKPWKKPLSRICWGLALITITLNFFYLDSILPSIGTVMLWLGLRSLRRQNGGFRFAFVSATLYAVFRFACLAVAATPLELWLIELIGMDWHSAAGTTSFYYVLRTVVAQLLLVLAVAGLWRGLKQVFLDAGQTPKTAPAGALVILEALLFPLAVIGLTGLAAGGSHPAALDSPNPQPVQAQLQPGRSGLRPRPRSDTAVQRVRRRSLAERPTAGRSGTALSICPSPCKRRSADIRPLQRRIRTAYSTSGAGLPRGHPVPFGRWTALSRFEGAYGVTVDGAFEDSPGDGSLPSFGMVEVPVRDDRYGFRVVYLAWFRWDSPEERYTEGIQIIPDLHGVTLRTTNPEGWLEWNEDQFHTAPLTFRLRSDGSYCADFSLPENGDALYGFVFWENIPTWPENITIYNYSITCAHRIFPWCYPYQLPSDVLLSNKLDPGWRSKSWRFVGQLAPEGKYENAKYAPAG